MASFDMNSITGVLLDTTGTISLVLQGLVLGGIALSILFLFQWVMSFKHVAILRVVTRNGKYIRRMRAKSRTFRGIHYWQFMIPFKRVLVSRPPKDAIEITKKGRYFAEANVTEENPNEPVWLVDTNKEYGAFQPLTTQERALHVQSMEEAENRRKKGLGEVLIAVAPYATMFLMFALLLVFFGDIVKPSQAVLDTASEVTKRFESITADQQQIMSDLARILEVSDIEVNQRIPESENLAGMTQEEFSQ